uniref:Uncharacterized protein n=1 Tax=Oncorhynchus tshawytscha TaxID=74940 RepID=A0A8C8LSZ9_ONCTS
VLFPLQQGDQIKVLQFSVNGLSEVARYRTLMLLFGEKTFSKYRPHGGSFLRRC